jgi:hypothetical protein
MDSLAPTHILRERRPAQGKGEKEGGGERSGTTSDVAACALDALPDELLWKILCEDLHPAYRGVAARTCWRFRSVLRMRRGISLAAAASTPALARWAVEEEGCPLSPALAAAAAAAGSLQVLVWLLRVKGCQWDPTVHAAAAGAGRLEALAWLQGDGGCAVSPDDLGKAAARAASRGHVHVLVWMTTRQLALHAANPRARSDLWRCWDRIIARSAGAAGRLHVLRWWYDDFGGGAAPRAVAPDCIMAAAASGHLHVLQWAHARGGCAWSTWVFAEAARGGSIAVLRWLRDTAACPWDNWACRASAAEGHLEVLQWLCAHGCPCDSWAAAEAAGGGHLAALQWLHDTRYALCGDAFNYGALLAALHGHVHVLQWMASLRGQAAAAAGAGAGADVDVDAAFPWRPRRMADLASTRGHVGVLQWLRDQGLWHWKSSLGLYTAAARGGHVQVIEWLHRQGFRCDSARLSKAVVNAIAAPRQPREGSNAALGAVIAWLHDHQQRARAGRGPSRRYRCRACRRLLSDCNAAPCPPKALRRRAVASTCHSRSRVVL